MRLNIIQETQSCGYIRKRNTARGSEYSPKFLVINKKFITNSNNYIKEFTLRAQPQPPIHFLIMDETFAPGDFAEKRVLKLVEWFSGHCRAIKS